MGTVELLTREGEIAIAKRIEEGLNQVQGALASFPWAIQLLIESESRLIIVSDVEVNHAALGFMGTVG